MAAPRETKNQRKEAAARAEQTRIEAVGRGESPRCGATTRLAGNEFVCIRPPHGGQHPNVDAHRRRKGTPPSADKHVMVHAR